MKKVKQAAEHKKTVKEAKEVLVDEKAVATKDNQMELANKDILTGFAGMGMKRVDPADIRPPHIILAQKSSSFDEMADTKGNKAKFGQFFHTAKREIYEEFTANFIFAAKGTYIDRRANNVEKEQYSVIGMMEDYSLFAMLLRGTAIYALSGLFAAAASQKIPMFAFNCKVESKLLSGAKGEWQVPVVRVGDIEKDPTRIDELFSMAKKFDDKSDDVDIKEE